MGLKISQSKTIYKRKKHSFVPNYLSALTTLLKNLLSYTPNFSSNFLLDQNLEHELSKMLDLYGKVPPNNEDSKQPCYLL